MAVLTETQNVQPTKRRRRHHPPNPNPNPKLRPSHHPWGHIKNMLTCKLVGGSSRVHDPVKNQNGSSKLGSCGSICRFGDVVNGNNGRVVHESPERTAAGKDPSVAKRRKPVAHGGVRATGGGSHTSRGMQLRKLSGCYECHAIVDPSRYTIPRATICVCSKCGEIFPKMESLEHHQAVRHAVSELGPEDSGRNIVEIIFKSSWHNLDRTIITIERILKVHTTRRTVQRFEGCRDAVKLRSSGTRCAADGNELLRFHCTTLACSLGHHGSSALCAAVPGCGVCTIIRHGFQGPKSAAVADGKRGVCTTASSGKAHDCLGGGTRGIRAMLVCRVIAGKVGRVAETTEAAAAVKGGAYDSVAGLPGSDPDLEELYVFNPRAILPCFVVIYKAMES